MVTKAAVTCCYLLLGEHSSHEVCLHLLIISLLLFNSFTYFTCSYDLKAVQNAHFFRANKRYDNMLTCKASRMQAETDDSQRHGSMQWRVALEQAETGGELHGSVSPKWSLTIQLTAHTALNNSTVQD